MEKNPINDLTYDWLTVLHSKAKGVNAYEKYIQDAKTENAQECVELFQKLQAQDVQALQEIRDHVAMMMSKHEQKVVPKRQPQQQSEPMRH